MKRFFQPVQADGCCKKRNAAHEAGADETADDEAGTGRDPTKFLSWNANSFLLRLKNDRAEFAQLVRSFDPDVIAVQEVRVPAAGRNGEPKNPAEIKDDTNAARDDKQTIFRALSTEPLSEFRAYWSLADSKYGGTALLIKNCFKPVFITYSITPGSAPDKHEPGGRAIVAEFKTFRLINTYVPNNGWKDEELGFKRRRQWDKLVYQFVTRPSAKPLIWCGDLNVSHEDIDVTHPEYFRTAKSKGYIPPHKEDVGQPGFTDAERRRFSKILSDANLVDSYRQLHQKQESDNGFTWSGNPVGMYRGKRMRIDYFLLSREMVGRLLRSEIHGSGCEMKGFCGSDHCPITMELSQTLAGPDKESKVYTTS